MSEREHWLAVARSTPLGIVTDLDGTLVPFAATPDQARPGPEVLGVLRELVGSEGVTVAVVSGRPREALDRFFSDCPGLLLVAEHGGWRRDRGAWQPAIEAEQDEVESLHRVLTALVETYPGAVVERKTWSVAFHVRAISPVERNAAVVEVDSVIAAWLAQHRGFALLRGAMVLEVRPARMVKGRAVEWVRDRVGSGGRLLALGDDITDEDTFAQLGGQDEAVLVSGDSGRPSAAGWQLDGPAEAMGLLRWVIAMRRGEPVAEETVHLPRRRQRAPRPQEGAARFRLLVVSNRLPELR
ncbi:MAG TPA: trehalose-phosphatase, partial [Kofleriaceae bacterium]|nr:trehalose-phosphatase [Kofleriaceae bacterium]